MKMGAAAYNRGSQAISEEISRNYEQKREFSFMDHLNSLPKLPGAPKPFGPINFVSSHSGWWAQCPVTGFGYFYKTLREAVQSFSVDVVGYEDDMWKAIPRAKVSA
jgi:hypothetical protein